MKGLRQAKPAILRAGSLISSVALLILLLILTVKSHQNLCSPLFYHVGSWVNEESYTAD